MVEANPTISQSLRFSMSRAAIVLAQQQAEMVIKQAIGDEGRRKVSQVPRREICLAARA